MSAQYMHIGIPVTNLRPGMTYNEGMKIWMSNPDDYDYKIEYLKFEDGTPFPEIMHKNPHIAFKVDDMTPYIAEAQQVIFGPVDNGPGVRLAFIIKDDTIIELYEEK
ncbi:MAG: hypothetical protein RR225_07855 [Clostridium sp.]